MARGISEILCKVCGKVGPGNCQATTCQNCLDEGYKWCKRCDTVKSLEEYTFLSTRNVYRPICKKCHSSRCSEYETEKRLTDEDFRLARNAAAAERMWYKSMTDPEWRAERNECNKAAFHKKYHSNPEYRAEILAATARRRQLFGDFTSDQWMHALEHFGHECAYCGAEEERLTVEHIIPVSKGGTGYIFNLIPSCALCNNSKGPKDIMEWYPVQYFYTEERLLKIHDWFKDMQKYLSKVGGDLND